MRQSYRSLIIAFVVSLIGHSLLFGMLTSWPLSGHTPVEPLPPPLLRTTLKTLTLSSTPASPPPPLPDNSASRITSRKPPSRPKPITSTEKSTITALPSAATEDSTAQQSSKTGAESDTAPDNKGTENTEAPLTSASPALPEHGALLTLQDWPTQGSISYRVYMGNNGFQVGEAEHIWWHDQTRYHMELKLKTNGVIGLIHRLQYAQRSEGTISANGLQPTGFYVTQQGKPAESALFDWQSRRVSIRKGEAERRTIVLTPGDQDILSIWHQIGIIGTSGLPHTLLLVGNKDAKVAHLDAVGTEQIELPIGRLNTLRLQAEAADASLSIDIWLALDYGMLPVRTRLTDQKGDVLDQQAIQLRLARPDTPTTQADGNTASQATPAMIELKERIAAHLDTFPSNN